MKTRLFIFTIVLFGFNIYKTNAQFGVYGSIPRSHRDTIFFDDFTSNKSYWSFGTNQASIGKVENGYYHWQSIYDKPRTTFYTVNISNKQDFEVESIFRMVSGSPNSMNAMVIDNLINGKYYLGCNRQGQYVVVHQQDSIRYAVPYTKSDIFDTTEYNKFTIRRTGSKLYFFINEALIYSEVTAVAGVSSVGFLVAENSIMHIENIKIDGMKRLYSLPQVGWTACTFDGIEITDKYPADSMPQWKPISTYDKIIKVEENLPYFETLTDSAENFSYPLPIDETLDYELDIITNISEGNPRTEFAFMWGVKQPNMYVLSFIPAGYLRLHQIDSTLKVYLPLDKNANIQPNVNRFTLRKIGRCDYLFVNKHLIWVAKHKPWYGKEIAFLVAPKSKMNIQSCTLYKLQHIETSNE